MDVLATTEQVFAPLAQLVPNYHFAGVVDPMDQSVDLPRVTGMPYASGFKVVQGGEPACFRSEVFEGFEVRLRVFDTVIRGRAAAGPTQQMVVVSLVDAVMEYLPENLAGAGLDSAWPGCLPGHSHPPEFRIVDDHFAWQCPTTHEIVSVIAAVE